VTLMPKRAVVVVHGIGQHQPYEMARTLTDSLLRIARETDPSARVEQVVPEVQAAIKTPPGRIYRVIKSTDMDMFVDVYEAYWAPLTAGLTSFLGIVWWLLVNTFIPSRMVRRPSGKTLYDVAASVCVLAIVALAYYGLFGALLQTTARVAPVVDQSRIYTPQVSFDLSRGISGTGQSLQLLRDSWIAPTRIPLGVLSVSNLGRVLSPVTLLYLLGTAVAVYALFQFVFRLGELLSDTRQFVRNIPSHVTILGISACVYLLALGSVVPEFFTYGYIYVAFRLVNLWIQKYFVNYIGDIEVYVTRDSKNARFIAREQIRSRAVDAIKAAVTSREDYAEVLVLGHSLGSVVGLDALRELRQQAGTVLSLNQFSRLTTFVTFGSPLEKTRFFFDRVSPDGGDRWMEFLREIQQTFLRQFPLPPQPPQLGQPPQPAGLAHRISWYNFWYFTDIIANSLESYNDIPVRDLVQVTQLPHPGARPWVHSAYVVDDRFLRPLYARLF
jgi:hypothetical protein